MHALPTLAVLVLAVLSLGSTGCDGPEVFPACDDLEQIGPALELVLFDLEGEYLTRGDLELASRPRRAESVLGTYRLDAGSVAVNQEGRLRVDVLDADRSGADRLRVALDIDVSDAGLALEGGCVGDHLEGSWSEVTIAGERPRGRFDLY